MASASATESRTRHQQPSVLVVDDLPTPPDVRRDDWQSTSRRLHSGTRKALSVGREDEEVESRVQGFDVAAFAQEDHARFRPGQVEVGLCQAGGLREVGPPDDDHDDLGPGVTQSPRRLEEFGEPLLPDQAAHDAGDHLVVPHTEGLPHG